MENLLCFLCLENLPVPHIESFHTSKLILNSPLLVLLVVIFSTKLVSPHSEFPCKSYCCFSANPGSTARGAGTTAPGVFAFAKGVVLPPGSTGPLPARLDLLPVLLFLLSGSGPEVPPTLFCCCSSSWAGTTTALAVSTARCFALVCVRCFFGERYYHW
jgi:hypothetical protein